MTNECSLQISRLFVRDSTTKTRFIIDSGADLTVFPASAKEKKQSPNSLVLYAANDTPIRTFGTKTLIINFGLKRTFRWDFIIADVSQPLIGSDFISYYGLLIDIKNSCLIDPISKLKCKGIGVQMGASITEISIASNFKNILADYADLQKLNFVSEPKHTIRHSINTTNEPPVFCKPRRLSPEKLKICKKEFDEMLRLGICRPSSSNWASPIHMVLKPNGEYRVCGDYRSLNSRTVPDRYAVPHIHDFGQMLNGKKIFSRIDIVKAYHHILVCDEDIKKTAVTTPFGNFEFPRMAFGLRNAAPTFQRFMNEVVRGLDFVYVYIDDILVASNNIEEHKEQLKMLFDRLRQYGLTLNISKCLFGVTDLEFLGYFVNSEGLKPLPSKVSAIINQKPPKNIKELQRFLGIINFYRRFIPNAAKSQAILHELSKGKRKKDNHPIEWTEQLKDAFEKCKTQLADATLLSFPEENALTSLCVDASDIAVGGVLQQCINGEWKPLGFFSKKLSQAQSKYSAYDRELLAVYAAVKHFQYFLEGRQFVIYTDHKPLIYAFKQKPEKASPRQLRYLDFISQHTTDIRHISGKDNVIADALSRIEALSMPSPLDYKLLQEEQQNDTELQQLLQSSNTGMELKLIQMLESDSKIYCDISTPAIRPYLTPSFKKNVFNTLHGLSHPGVKATVDLISKRYIWPSLKKDVSHWTKCCEPCQQSKVGRHTKSPLGSFEAPTERFQYVNIDIVGPLPISKGFRYIFTCIDRFTKWAEAAPIVDITAENIANVFINIWVSRFGVPKQIITDQGRQFESQLFRELAKKIGAKVVHTTPYHPQSNGLIERWHRTLKAALKCHQRSCWVDALPLVLLGLRTKIIEDTDVSVAEMVYGTTLKLPGEFIDMTTTTKTSSDWILWFKDTMSKLQPLMTSNHGSKNEYVNNYLKTCNFVFVRCDAVRRPLQPPYDGPFKVLSRTDKIFKILIKGKEKYISIDRLKPALMLDIDDPDQRASPQTTSSPTEREISPPKSLVSQTSETGIKLRSGRRVSFKDNAALKGE